MLMTKPKKKTSKKKVKRLVWLVDDYQSLRELHAEAITGSIANAEVREFSCVDEAKAAVGKPDVIVVDMTAVSPIFAGPEIAYKPIAELLDLHPGASIIVCSSVCASFAEEVITAVKQVSENAVIEYCNVRDGNIGLVDAIKETLGL